MMRNPTQHPLNLYNDTIVDTTGLHGADIASQRMDELDLEALRFTVSFSEAPEKVALDLGCGLGFQGIRLAMLGWQSFLYDMLDIHDRIALIREVVGVQGLEFRKLDLRQATSNDFPLTIGLVYSQRFIHYLRFDEASRLLAIVASKLYPSGRLFLSASGMESELGLGYVASADPVEVRFGVLAPEMQEKHTIYEPVCLYREEELQNLVLPYGFRAVRVWSSPFGNVKGIFEKV
jgi:SAM-dependent methyltransferase